MLNFDSPGRTSWLGRNIVRAWVAALVIAMAPVAGFTQETTAGMRGTVSTPDGTPATGVQVVVTDTRTGNSRTTSTGSNGVFQLSGLRVGGPYNVRITSDRYSDQTVSELFLNLGETYTFDVSLRDVAMEEIVVTASALQFVDVAVGPSSTFDLNDLTATPAVNRDIRDMIRIDPRIYIDEAFVDSINCAGANPRFNSLTVDGVRLNDAFGLNSNGYPTERMPFSFDAIQQVAVELAPFDVEYGGFTACNINAVTKSGTNEFHGSVFYDFTSDSLTGDKLEGDSIDLGSFDEDRYGITFGGPIIKDNLFFFVAYEKLEGANVFDRGPAGSGRGREIAGVSQADFDLIDQTARNVYDYDPGGLPASLPVEDEKLLVKFDWNINDAHRAAFTYNYNDGFNIAQADGDDNELEFSNHYYERGAELDSYSLQLFSDWSENFFTELRVGYTELDNRQISLGGTDFGEFQITTFNDPDNDGVLSRATVYLGADDSRHANKLKYDNTNIKLAGSYILGDHVITAGVERESFDVFNLFIQEAEGEFRFSSVQDFIDGTPNRITYENARITNNPNDAAANFQYDINTLYLQDEWTIPSLNLTLVGGLRYEGYDSDDVPPENPNFVDRYGYSNAKSFDGESLLQPRLGFTWEPLDSLSVRGGIGLYSGGNPNVWLSNNYSNNGITQVEVQDRSLDDPDNPDTLFTIETCADEECTSTVSDGSNAGFGIPKDLFDAVASGTVDSGVNAIDRDFDIPSEFKFAIGASWFFDAPFNLGRDYRLDADLLYSKSRDSAIITDATLEQIGTAPDGRPIYRGIDRSDPDCADPTSPDCSGRTQDFLLSNADDDGEQTVFSVALSRSHDWGLDWTFAYAYTEATDANPMTSSVAFSNFSNIAVSDPNNPEAARSNYEIQNRFTLRLDYERAFFGDLATRFTVFGSANEGRPFSYTFTDGFMFGDSVGFISRHLLYVPTGLNDPNVVFDAGFNTDAFFQFVNDSGLSEFSGQISNRNAFKSSWWTKFDVKIEQELPGFADDHNFEGFLIIENFGNFLNDDWGVLKEAGFPRTQPVVEASINDQNQYVFENFFEPQGQGRATDASLWEIRVGVRYQF